MFERITVNQRQGETQNDRSETRISRDSIEVQIGVLKEVAVSLLQQIETLKRGTVSQTSDNGKSLHDEVRDFEIDLINSALARTHGHQRKAASLLGLKVTTLNAKMKRYKILSRFYMPIGDIASRN